MTIEIPFMKSNLSLDDLQIFQQVAQHGGITATARATGLPAATLSRRLKQLERAVGGRLLERNAHHFALTELGRAITSAARHCWPSCATSASN
ncbi:LysR family transcriptional regulator [Ottowia pentelensis]|uniref:LysR family transcriptional regulator n=1 Tax=Ottowia pentelensis TaxID=511108 RepID=UPI003635D152